MTDKTTRLLDRNARGISLANLVKHSETEKFFADYESRTINDIVAADTDEERAKEVLRLSVCREFRKHLERIVKAGETAGKRLETARESGDALESKWQNKP